MRNRLRTVMFGIGLMILLAQPAFAEELGQANITPRTKMAEIRSNPSVVGAGIYTYSLDQDRVLDRMYWDAQPLSCLSNHWTAIVFHTNIDSLTPVYFHFLRFVADEGEA